MTGILALMLDGNDDPDPIRFGQNGIKGIKKR